MHIALQTWQPIGEQRVEVEAKAVGGQMCYAASIERDRMLAKVRVKLLG